MNFSRPSSIANVSSVGDDNHPRPPPRAVIVSTILSSRLEFERTQAHFLERLEQRVATIWATNPSEVVDHFVSVPLSNTSPLAVLLIDSSLLLPQNAAVLGLVRQFILRGGRVITMWHFGVPEPGDHTHRLYFNNFFSRLGPGWILGDRQTAQIVLNPQAAEESMAVVRRLPPCFTLEGQHIQVYEETHSCYTATRLLAQTPIALARVWKGGHWICWRLSMANGCPFGHGHTHDVLVESSDIAHLAYYY